MYREYQQRAQAAMQMAIAAPADERHLWVQAALLWQLLGSTKNIEPTAPRWDAPICTA
jgi:hypothetical protein